jgi:hypothetical protein
MGEQTYMDKGYCLECMGKHSRDLEHHLEDFVTSSKDNPDLRAEAQVMVDAVRDIRKNIDDLRLDELARKKLSTID